MWTAALRVQCSSLKSARESASYKISAGRSCVPQPPRRESARKRTPFKDEGYAPFQDPFRRCISFNLHRLPISCVAPCYHMPHLPACKSLAHTGNAYSSPFLPNANEPVSKINCALAACKSNLTAVRVSHVTSVTQSTSFSEPKSRCSRTLHCSCTKRASAA